MHTHQNATIGWLVLQSTLRKYNYLLLSQQPWFQEVVPGTQGRDKCHSIAPNSVQDVQPWVRVHRVFWKRLVNCQLLKSPWHMWLASVSGYRHLNTIRNICDEKRPTQALQIQVWRDTSLPVLMRDTYLSELSKVHKRVSQRQFMGWDGVCLAPKISKGNTLLPNP